MDLGDCFLKSCFETVLLNCLIHVINEIFNFNVCQIIVVG